MTGFLNSAGAVSVLIVDDDEVSREVLATVLTIHGCTVQTACDGGEAVRMLGAGNYKPEVILADLCMPGLSGSELIAQLRKQIRAGHEDGREPGYKSGHEDGHEAGHEFRPGTAVVAMSASEPPAEDVENADGFLLKPFGAKEFERVLKKDGRWTARGERPEESAADTLNRRKLEQFRRMMPERAVREIYTTAVTDLHRRLRDLEAATERGDGAAVRHIGHAIKGGSGMAGAEEAARVGAMLEGVDDDLKNVLALTALLRKAVRNLEDALAAEFPLL
jgi:CheY-like chemotaxis protein